MDVHNQWYNVSVSTTGCMYTISGTCIVHNVVMNGTYTYPSVVLEPSANCTLNRQIQHS